uniref:Cyclin-like domain-containing protein n=1 Tax=Nelumbo nucifera TaxID=4432 RepID=A0A822YIH0_NELNU|nr:TPA_asm: hypothetical protein HUJ06_011133 [Nelumbo nucifera]
MNRATSNVLQRSNSRRKRKIQPASHFKKLRSKINRRKRSQISPILRRSSNSMFVGKKTEFSAFPAASSSASCFSDEISCNSNWISEASQNLKKKPRSIRRKRGAEEIRGPEVEIREGERSFCQPKKTDGEQFRRITRSFYRLEENKVTMEKKGSRDRGMELSELSCVDSFSGADVLDDGKSHDKTHEVRERNLTRKRRARKGAEKADENEENTVSEVIALSEASCDKPLQQENVPSLSKPGEFSGEVWKLGAKIYSPGIHGNEVSSDISCLESITEAKNLNLCPFVDSLPTKAMKDEENRAQVMYVESNIAVSNSESNAEHKAKFLNFNCDLTCSEKFTYETDSNYSISQDMTISQLESEIFPRNSDIDFSDLSPLFSIESSSDFSEQSNENSPQSDCFLLLLQFTQQFSKLSFHPDVNEPSHIEDEYFDEFTLMRFEDEEQEESYKMLRRRERKQVFLHDYAEEYCSTTEYGELVLRQRFQMVNWIIEQANAKNLQPETMFLGVSLLDRFLSRGFFNNTRNLQLVGIACLTLATRIEENQPFNWFYLKAASADEEVERRAKYLALLSLLDHEQLCYWPSTVAAGLVILACLAANRDSSCQCVMETHVRSKNDDLPECIQSLEWLVKYVH